MAHFVQSALHRAPALDHFARDLHNDGAVTVVSPASSEPARQLAHQGCSSLTKSLSASSVTLPPEMTMPTFLPANRSHIWYAAASDAAPAPSATIRVVSSKVTIARRNSESVTRQKSSTRSQIIWAGR